MRYLRRFLLAFFALLGMIAAFNGLMDATGLLSAPIIDGVNQLKTFGTDRFFKPLAVDRRQPHIIFVGTSRVAIGLDPHDLPGAKAYNLGLLGSTVPEHIAFARYAVDNAPVERIVFGLDFAPFLDSARFSTAFRLAILKPHAFWRSLPDLLLSQSELLQSRSTFTHSWRRIASRYAADGMLIAANEHNDDPDPIVRGLRKVEQYARLYHSTGSSERALEDFDAFLAALPPRVAISVYVTPAHAVLHEALQLAGLEPEYEAWLRRVTDICARRDVTLWDFNGYNAITTVPLAASAENFVDGAHTTPQIGRLVLAALLPDLVHADSVTGFGVRLTPDMLSDYLLARHTAGEAWRRDYPDDARRAMETASRASMLETTKVNAGD